jgi:hypothetical protein
MKLRFLIPPFLILVLLLQASVAFAGTWTLEQSGIHTGCTTGSTTCAATITAPQTGQSDVMWVSAGSFVGAGGLAFGTISSIVLSGGGGSGNTTFTLPSGGVANTGCSAQIANSSTDYGEIDCGYLINPGNYTTVTVTLSVAPGQAWYLLYAEWQTSNAAAYFDAVSATCYSGGSTCSAATSTASNPVGPTLTLGGTNDAILQWNKGGNTASAVSGGYSELDTTWTGSDFNGAYLANTASGSGPTFTAGVSRWVVGGIAFRDTNPAVPGGVVGPNGVIGPNGVL